MSCLATLHVFRESLLQDFAEAAKPIKGARWFRQPKLLFPIHDWLSRNAREHSDLDYSGYVVGALFDGLDRFGASIGPLVHAPVAKAIDPQAYIDVIWSHSEAQHLSELLSRIDDVQMDRFLASDDFTLLKDNAGQQDITEWKEALVAAINWLRDGLSELKPGEVAYLSVG